MQEVDRYRETGEGSMIAFILKTDKKIDMIQYLDKEGIEALKDYAGTTLQSEFMIVSDWEVFESFSYKDFAAKYAHKRICVSGTLFFPMAGWLALYHPRGGGVRQGGGAGVGLCHRCRAPGKCGGCGEWPHKATGAQAVK